MKRRSFFAVLAGLVAAPFVWAKAKPKDSVQYGVWRADGRFVNCPFWKTEAELKEIREVIAHIRIRPGQIMTLPKGMTFGPPGKISPHSP